MSVCQWLLIPIELWALIQDMLPRKRVLHAVCRFFYMQLPVRTLKLREDAVMGCSPLWLSTITHLDSNGAAMSDGLLMLCSSLTSLRVGTWPELTTLTYLPNLEYLSILSDCYAPLCWNKTISECTTLVGLDISISTLNPDLTGLTRLTQLCADLCPLTIENIPSGLAALDISRTRTITSVSSLNNLRELVVTGPNRVIASSIGRLTNLTYLNVSRGHSGIPAVNLTNLTYLNIGRACGSTGADVMDLPTTTRLLTLLASANGSVAGLLYRLAGLTCLDVSSSRVVTSTSISMLTNLVELYISNTEVSNINTLTLLTRLEAMSTIIGSRIGVDGFSRCVKLRYLNIEENRKIHQLQPFTLLNTLIARGCTMHASDMSCCPITYLDISDTWIYSLNELTNLTELRAHRCYNLSMAGVSRCTRLTIIKAKASGLSEHLLRTADHI